MMGEDAREDLGGPLVGQRLVLGTVDAGAFERSGVVFRDVLEEALSAVAVGASRDRDDDAAFVECRLGGGHTLDGLVDVLVERW